MRPRANPTSTRAKNKTRTISHSWSGRWIGDRTPGQDAWRAPEGTGIEIVPGSSLIVQVHYNLNAAAPQADQSHIELELSDSVERPGGFVPIVNPEWVFGLDPMEIPAGDPDVHHHMSVTREHPVFGITLARLGLQPEDELLIYRSALHMHMRGTRASLRLRESGSEGEDTCMLQIDDWDFNWQGDYILDRPLRPPARRLARVSLHGHPHARRSPAALAHGSARDQDPPVRRTGALCRGRDLPVPAARSETKRDLPGLVDALASRVGVELDAGERAAVIERSSLPYMRAHDRCFAPPRLALFGGSPPKMVRRGRAGGSDELLDAEQQARIDDHARAQLRRRGSELPYDELFGTRASTDKAATGAF